jgi:SAM-dependent methyltransferase
MDDVALEEKRKYDLLWTKVPGYRDVSPGQDLAPLFLALVKKELDGGQTLIDFGCGTGRAAKEFLIHDLRVQLVDISPECLDQEIQFLLHVDERLQFHEACLWDLPKEIKSAPWLFCCDVLEHIPENRIDAVLKNMALRMENKGLFSICMKEEHCRGQLEFPLHLTVRPLEWWHEQLGNHFEILAEKSIEEGLYGVYFVGKKGK